MDLTLDVLENVLADLKKVSGVQASAAASRDGLLIKAVMPTEHDAENIAAMSATILGAAEAVTAGLGKGVPKRVIVEFQHGKLIATGAGSKALLVVLCIPDSDFDMILPELEKASKIIKEFLRD